MSSSNGGHLDDDDDVPQSVEEAGALLGAAITRCGVSTHTTIVPPKGMHSSFATISPVPSSELLTRLHSLRSLLRSVPRDQQPLVAAPSLLAVLMKLLRVSSSLATTLLNPNTSQQQKQHDLTTTSSSSKQQQQQQPQQQQHRISTPPMLSTALRHLWVDCVVLCHTLGEGLSGHARMDLYAFVRAMMALASTNPKSHKAAGGTRIAALQVMGGLFCKNPTRLAPWALDVLNVCVRALKSSGSGEPTHRIAAVRTARAVVGACREAYRQRYSSSGEEEEDGGDDFSSSSRWFVMTGAMEDRAIVETCKLLKQASSDKFSEVRAAAADVASAVAPMLLHAPVAAHASSHGGAAKSTMEASSSASITTSSPTGSLEEVILLAVKNLDDEMAGVAVAWTEALARCLSTCIQHGEQMRAVSETSSRRSAEDDPEGAAAAGDAAVVPDAPRFGSRKAAVGVAQQCSTLALAISYLVDQFVKVGGELAASRGGGSFSIGGRASRIGLSLALVKLLRLQSICGNIGQGTSTEQVITAVLNMVGPDFEKQVQLPDSGSSSFGIDATPPISSPADKGPASLFGPGRNKSHADPGLARQATNRVLREGLAEVAPEMMQLTMLRELIAACGGEGGTTSQDGRNPDSPPPLLNGHQLQVVLIEISHLLTTLGEAATSCLPELVPALHTCLAHPTHGVRHEAAIACAAMAGPFPSAARKLLRSSINEIQLNHAELVKLASTEEGVVVETPSSTRRRRFGRVTAQPAHPSMVHQYAIHGHCLMVSILLRELPHLPGGLTSDLLMSSLSVSEILVNCQYNAVLTKANAGAVCTCVRAGYSIICGSLTIGAKSITPHISLIFELWQKIGDGIKSRDENFSHEHEILCLDAAVSSVVAFLKHDSELLLNAPDALSGTTLLLERLLPLFMPEGRLGVAPSNPVAASSHDALKASLMEAFAWLPPGSFPMVADQVFALAARHIRSGTEAEVTCSLLPSLVNKEDEILDAKSLERAQRYGQVGGARDIDENLIALTSEAAHHGERESVLHFETSKVNRKPSRVRHKLRESEVLGMFANDVEQRPAPTPLHEVGTWREPASPSCSSKVRLVDAAVQSFSATFGLKDGKEQHKAMLMLESLVPPFLAQLARAIGMNTALTEPERRAKAKGDNAAVANITAVLLACLQALPLHEATHDVAIIVMGPPWMNKAKDLLLTLLPSASNIVRRAAAEGLALLATLGVTEDAHTLQSTVLHSLDEVMEGNQPDGKPRPLLLESVSAARAGSLLTLACIQRTAHRIKEEHKARARGRASTTEAVTDTQSDALPTIQMMTRILPSLTCHGMLRDAFVVRTYAMHSFGLLIAYSQQNNCSLSEENIHLLKKAVEVVEDNFLASWTAVSADFDKGQEAEKFSREASFLAVLLRMMTFLVPTLRLMDDPSGVATRFSVMATLIMESYGAHPVVFIESLAFFERLAAHQSILPPLLPSLLPSENSLNSCIPFVFDAVNPVQFIILTESNRSSCRGCQGSVRGLRAAVRCLKLLSAANVTFSTNHSVDYPSSLFPLLEATCGSRIFTSETSHRSLAAPRQVDITDNDRVTLETELVQALDTLLFLESKAEQGSDQKMLHWILSAKTLVSGKSVVATVGGTTDTLAEATSQALRRSSSVGHFVAQCRWQVKCQATHSATAALDALASGVDLETSPHFDPALAHKKLREMNQGRDSSSVLPSFLVFHLAEVLGFACNSSVATLDQSELRLLQAGGVRFLSKLVACFGDISDVDDTNQKILEQFSSQIQSSVKHSISAIDDDEGEATYQLFICGCKALQNIVAHSLVTDPLALKRLLRPLVPSPAEVPFFSYGSPDHPELFPQPLKESSFSNQRELLLPRIGKLWTLGKLRELLDNGFIPAEAAEPMLQGVSACRSEIAVNSAAIALDASRLLCEANLTLCGMPRSDDSRVRVFGDHGLLYRNKQDIDLMTRAAMVEAWPSCACSGMVNLLEATKSDDLEESRKSACMTWAEKLIPVILTGLHDAMESLHSKEESRQSSVQWASGLETEEAVVMCLHSIGVLFINGPDAIKKPFMAELAQVVSSLSHTIVRPIIAASTIPEEKTQEDAASSNPEGDADDENIIKIVASTELVTESCKFMEKITACADLDSDVLESAMLMAVLEPLHVWQTGKLQFDDKHVTQVTASCLLAVRNLIRLPNAKESLVLAMLQLSVDMVSFRPVVPATVTQAAEVLLEECLSHEKVPTALQKALGQEMARDNKWEAWATICLQSKVALSYTIPEVRAALEDLSKPTVQLAALSAARKVMQAASSELITIVMHGLGASVLALLQAYGTLALPQQEDVVDHRTAACADATKILMLAYATLGGEKQQQQQQQQQENLSSFLSVIFDVLTALIAYNGLPNQASPQPHADPALGRLAAMSIVHVARSTPAAFKESMATLSDRGRALLEFAVRADMSGYVSVTSNAPAKKKLNLQSYTTTTIATTKSS